MKNGDKGNEDNGGVCSQKNGKCRHPSLCRAQGENFCLQVHNHQRRKEYLKRKQKVRDK